MFLNIVITWVCMLDNRKPFLIFLKPFVKDPLTSSSLTLTQSSLACKEEEERREPFRPKRVIIPCQEQMRSLSFMPEPFTWQKPRILATFEVASQSSSDAFRQMTSIMTWWKLGQYKIKKSFCKSQQCQDLFTPFDFISSLQLTIKRF